MSRRSPHANKQLSANAPAGAREASYLTEGYDADQNTLFNALSGAGFGHAGQHDRHIPGHTQHIDGTLLEAVTSAAGADLRNGIGQAVLSARQANGTQQQEAAEEAVSLIDPSLSGKSKRKRASDGPQRASDGSQQHHFTFRNDPSVTMSKRQKTTHQDTDQQAQGTSDMTVLAPQNALANVENSEFESPATGSDASVFFSEYVSPVSMSDARASGVYSAAALFRKPTEASRKYTRPPMSKLFTSLELAPERFIRLQSAAKAFMLDPDHEERLNCVGNRAKLTKFDDSKGNMDMAKLRLYHCVKEFLETDDIGEEYFGRQAEGAAARDWFWPRDGNKVISLVTPLLRRMITNERQRQYAVESRKAPADTDSTRPSKNTPNLEDTDLDAHVDPQLASQGQASTRRSELGAAPREPVRSLRFAIVRRSGLDWGTPQQFIRAFKRDYRKQSFDDIRGEAQEAHRRAATGADGIAGKAQEAGVADDEDAWVMWAHIDSGRKKIASQADWNEALDVAETQMPYIDGELTVVVEVGLGRDE